MTPYVVNASVIAKSISERNVCRGTLPSWKFSFLAILKLFGKGNPNLSFPLEGFTLALDFPHNKNSKDLVKKFDAILKRFNGKIYLTKDSMTSKKTLPNTFWSSGKLSPFF